MVQRVEAEFGENTKRSAGRATEHRRFADLGFGLPNSAVTIELKTIYQFHSAKGAFHVSEFQLVRRQQIVREAEGYLDLAMACGDHLTLSIDARNRLAERALRVLKQLAPSAIYKSHVAYLTGQALRLMERYQDAIVHLEKAAENDPDDMHIWLALGWCYKRTGRLDLAIESLEKAMEFDDEQAIIYYNLACYWSLAENCRWALDYLTRALEIDSSFRDMVADEKDFNPIRDDPRFQELTSVIV